MPVKTTKAEPRKSVSSKKTAPASKTADIGPFAGFSKQAIQFLKDLKKHQDRDWFRERKDQYEELVRQPMEALVTEASAACRKRGFPLYTREKTPVMRVYRDIRFSSNKDPFNTHVGASLKKTPGKDGFGEIYIHISPESSFVAAGFWMPEKPFVNAWRKSMDTDPKKFLALLAHLQKNKLEFGKEKPLTRMPRGYEKHQGSKLEDHFKLISYVIHRPLLASAYTSPKLIDDVVSFALLSRPLLEYGWELNHQPAPDPIGVSW